MLKISDNTIDEVLATNEYTVIDFWAPWCGPCKALGPTFEALAAENSDITMAKMDITDNSASTQRFMISSIPCIIFFKNGEEVKRVKGFVAKSILQDEIDELKK